MFFIFLTFLFLVTPTASEEEQFDLPNMTAPFVFTEMLTASLLPYLEQATATHALDAVTTAVRALVLCNNPPTRWMLTVSNERRLFMHRAWWYRGGWRARIAVESVDDVVAVVHAGVTNVADISFCGRTVAEVYVTAATHFASTVVSIERAHLRSHVVFFLNFLMKVRVRSD